MTTTYWVSNIQIPADSIDKIKALLTENGLEENWPFEIDQDKDGEGNGFFLTMTDSNMSYSTTEEVDSFLEALAEILKSTKFDGQQIEYEFEDLGSKGYYIFLNGELHDLPLDIITLHKENSKVGQVYNETVTVKVLGLPNNEIVIIGKPSVT
jgi:hypothetical protein